MSIRQKFKISCYLGVFCFGLGLTNTASALDDPLLVAVDNFAPPFVFRAGNNVVYGFDIDMIQSVCNILQRKCQFVPLAFRNLVPAVANNDYPIAVGSITISPERSGLVNFSIPYLLSNARLLSNKTIASQPYSPQLLAGKTIGVEAGTLFPQVIQLMGIPNPVIKTYDSNESVLEALREGEVDAAMMDNPTAQYWQTNASGIVFLIGKPINYGFGYGIAVNKNEPQLLNQINQAIQQYHNSADFKTQYNHYFLNFE